MGFHIISSNVNFRDVRKHVEKKMGLERKALAEHKDELKQIMAVTYFISYSNRIE